MRQLATTDSLTGSPTGGIPRRRAERRSRARLRYGGGMGLVMADLDRFKAVNDEAGHGAATA
jgi:GGDEF domain-containing protein